MRKKIMIVLAVSIIISVLLSANVNAKEYKTTVVYVSKVIFSKPSSIKIYKNKVYVLDRKGYNVKIMNLKGEMIKTFGRKGEGPGEFKNLSDFDIKNNKIFVLDNETIKIFDTEGNFKKSFRVVSSAFYILVLKDRIVISGATIIPETREWFYIYDFNGNLLNKNINKKKIKLKSDAMSIMSNFKYVFKIDEEHFAYISRYNKKPVYTITKVNYNGKIMRVLNPGKKIKFKKTFITFKGKRIYAIFQNGLYYKGYYFLQPFRYKKKLYKGKFDVEPSDKIYIFDNNGRFKGVCEFPNKIKVFTYRDGNFYIIDDDYELKIYKHEQFT